jgi:hypothetical protein
VKITDPALVEDGVLASALEDEFRAQKKQHPDARIVAVCERDFGASYMKILVAVPGTQDLMVEGFDELETTGDLRATLAAVGIDPDGPGEGRAPRVGVRGRPERGGRGKHLRGLVSIAGALSFHLPHHRTGVRSTGAVTGRSAHNNASMSSNSSSRHSGRHP